jgi:hypothetical protein
VTSGRGAEALYVSGDALTTMTPGGIGTGYEEDGSLGRRSGAAFRTMAERACSD